MDRTAGKRAAGRAAAMLVEDGMIIGIGSASTANQFQAAVAERIKTEGLRIRAVAPSHPSEENARNLGITLIPLERGITVDLAVDGADEITPELNAIKGGGGALVREKLVVAAAKRFIVIADDSKLVPTLGAFPLPVALIPFGWERTVQRIEEMFEIPVTVRGGVENPFISDDGLRIVDLHFQAIPDPMELNARLRSTVGIADCGLFVGMAHQALLGAPDGSIKTLTL